MSFLEDFVEINAEVMKKTIGALKNNAQVLLIGIPYILAAMILLSVSGMFGIFAGIIMFLGLSALVSSYLYIINNIITYGTYESIDIKNGLGVYLRKLYILLLIYWFFKMAVSLFLSDIMAIVPAVRILFDIFELVLVVVLSALPEVVYQKHFGDFENVTYALDFFKENWKEWGIPNAILIGMAYILYYLVGRLTMLFVTISPFAYGAVSFVIFSILIQAILPVGMIYRGYLFKILSISSKRKRQYMKNMFRN